MDESGSKSLSAGMAVAEVAPSGDEPQASETSRNTLMGAILDAAVDGLCIFDAKGCLLEVNTAFERLTGVKRNEWVGRNLDELRKVVAEKRWIVGHLLIREVMEGRWPATTLFSVKGNDLLLASASPDLGPDGQIRHIILNVRNITQLNHLKYELELGRGRATLADIERFRAGYLQSRLKVAGLENIVIESPIMKRLLSMITQIADFDVTILLEGETGVGKGIIARFIHRLSRRAGGPFVQVNCGALPENLVESELYGYRPGAFTGSLRSGKKGQFEVAEGGTIFLDELSELSPGAQTKLLKFMDDKMIHAVGGTTPRHVDVRIVAATNKNLRELADSGQFRQDLLYRLEVIPLYVPALRERREDLRALVYSFMEQFNREFGLNRSRALGSEALRVLLAHNYPGNIRELKNLMSRLVLTASGPEITVHDLPEYLRESRPHAALVPDLSMRKEDRIFSEAMSVEPLENDESHLPERLDLQEKIEETERRFLARYAQQCHSTYELAEQLGISQASITRKLLKHGVRLGPRQFDRELGPKPTRGSEMSGSPLECGYPANTQELRNQLAQLLLPIARLLLPGNDLEITIHDLADKPGKVKTQPAQALKEKDESKFERVNLLEKIEETERRLLAHYARRCRSTYELGDRLGISQATAVRKLRKHGIPPPSQSDKSNGSNGSTPNSGQ